MDNNEAIARIREHMRVHRIGEPPHVYIAEALEAAIVALERQGDSIEIVHCGECQFFDDIQCAMNDWNQPPENFCCYGKRKEEE